MPLYSWFLYFSIEILMALFVLMPFTFLFWFVYCCTISFDRSTWLRTNRLFSCSRWSKLTVSKILVILISAYLRTTCFFSRFPIRSFIRIFTIMRSLKKLILCLRNITKFYVENIIHWINLFYSLRLIIFSTCWNWCSMWTFCWRLWIIKCWDPLRLYLQLFWRNFSLF